LEKEEEEERSAVDKLTVEKGVGDDLITKSEEVRESEVEKHTAEKGVGDELTDGISIEGGIFQKIREILVVSQETKEELVPKLLKQLAQIKNWGIAMALVAEMQHNVMSNQMQVLSLDPGALDNLDPQGLMNELNKFLCSKNENMKRTIKFEHSGGKDPVNGRIRQVIEDFCKKMTEIISQHTEQGGGDLFGIEERTTGKQANTNKGFAYRHELGSGVKV
jgi:hypothetical protein